MFIQNLSYLENIEYKSDCSGSLNEVGILRAVDVHLRRNDAMIAKFCYVNASQGLSRVILHSFKRRTHVEKNQKG